jgi:hypothetical protein
LLGREIFHDLASLEAEAWLHIYQIHREVCEMNSTEPQWTYEAVQSLVALAREGTPVSVISLKLKRSIVDVRAKLNDLGITPPAET